MKKICTVIVLLIAAFIYFKFSDSDLAKNVRETGAFKTVENKVDSLKDDEKFWKETVVSVDSALNKIKAQANSEYKVNFRVENSFKDFEAEIPVSKETYKKLHVKDDVTKDLGFTNEKFRIIVVNKRREKNK